MIKYVVILALAAVTLAQDFDNFAQSPLSLPPRPAPAKARPSYSPQQSQAPRQPPVAILKQIDRHNEDGSYTYGYESADGSFKIETKGADGQIRGKYGYTDDVGKIRVVEYGASNVGFEPVGEGITVPPPTLVDETTDKNGNLLPEYSGEDPENPTPAQAPARANYNIQPARIAQSNRAPVLQQSSSGFEYTAPSFEPAPRPAAPSQFNFNEAARASFAPAPRPASTAPLRPALIPGAQPAPISEPRGLDSYSRPSQALSFQPAQQQQPLQFAATPRFAQAAPRPIAAAPRPAAPAYRPAGGYGGGGLGGGSILDQLSKDFALPAGNNVLDISFGSGK